MDAQYEIAKHLLTTHKKILDKGASLVLKEESIEGDRLKQLLEAGKGA